VRVLLHITLLGCGCVFFPYSQFTAPRPAGIPSGVASHLGPPTSDPPQPMHQCHNLDFTLWEHHPF
jgi:hypothetical protein